MLFKTLVLLGLITIGSSVFADGLTQLKQDDILSISKELGAAFKHTSVNDASIHGDQFNWEIGVTSGDSSATRLRELLRKGNSSTDLSSIPHFGFLGSINLSSNLVIEGIYLPKISGRFAVSSQSLAIKWNYSISELPNFNFSIKPFYGTTKVNWSQTVSSMTSNLSYSQNLYGIDFQASKNFGIFEPYLTLGYINNTGNLLSDNSAIFDSNYTTGSSVSEKTSSSTFGAGISANFIKVIFGLELTSTLGATVTSFKTSANF